MRCLIDDSLFSSLGGGRGGRGEMGVIALSVDVLVQLHLSHLYCSKSNNCNYSD